MNELITISNVRGRLDTKGNPELNLEDVARGLGFTQRKGRTEYVRWERVKQHLASWSFPTCGEDSYIPENIFYKLCFKAENSTAQKFQDTVTDEVLPAIRKHGAYMTPAKIEEVLLNPDTIIHLATQLKAEREARQIAESTIQRQTQIIGELKPRADYTDRILQSRGTVAISLIAKDYGMSAQEMNKLLHGLGIQYKQGKTWLLYTKYQSKGFTHSKTFDYNDSEGRPQVRLNTEWTQKGRLFLYELLKESDYLPLIEQSNASA